MNGNFQSRNFSIQLSPRNANKKSDCVAHSFLSNMFLDQGLCCSAKCVTVMEIIQILEILLGNFNLVKSL
jgi:hypothetical protein